MLSLKKRSLFCKDNINLKSLFKFILSFQRRANQNLNSPICAQLKIIKQIHINLTQAIGKPQNSNFHIQKHDLKYMISTIF